MQIRRYLEVKTDTILLHWALPVIPPLKRDFSSGFSLIFPALTGFDFSGKMKAKDRASATDGIVEHHMETEADISPTVWAVLLDTIELSFILF